MKDYKRLGIKRINNSGDLMTIVNYKNNSDIDIEFEDGTLVKNRTFQEFKKGHVKKPQNRVGIKNTSYCGELMEIVNYTDSSTCDILFEDGTLLKNRRFDTFISGYVKNPYRRIIENIGYIGEGKYDSKSIFYKPWQQMIIRSYSLNINLKLRTYKGCTVCEEWHNFQNFAQWYEDNYNPKTMEGWHLDKDILVKGNKIYSPETCCLVPSAINNLFLQNKSDRNLPIGVTKRGNRFETSIRKDGVYHYLGRFDTIDEAYTVYAIEKEKYIKLIADRWKDLISKKVYTKMHNYSLSKI